MVSPSVYPYPKLTADTIHLCASDSFPILQAEVYQSSPRLSWYLNGSLISNEIAIKPTEAGVYKLVAQGYAYGEDYWIEKIVVIDTPLLYSCETIIPNVFTPNGDGHNDTFTILNIEHYPNSSLEIYARWGRKIFESSNYRNEWNGADQPDGSYFFIFRRNDGQEFKGSVTILR